MRSIKTFRDCEIAVNELESFIDTFRARNLDINGRRVINAGKSKEPNDYITRSELPELIRSKVAGENIFGEIPFITTDEIADLAIVTKKLGPLAVTGGKIVDNAITTTKIANNSISTPKLQANSVTANEIAANAIISVKILAGAVITAKLDTAGIDVGGGGGKPVEFNVFNAAGTKVGFIGTEAGNDGAWFKTISVGGTSYATGKLKGDAAGNITVSDADITVIDSASNRLKMSGSGLGLRIETSGAALLSSLQASTLLIDDPAGSVTNYVNLSAVVGLGGSLLLRNTSGIIKFSGSSGSLTLTNPSGSAALVLDASVPKLDLLDSAANLQFRVANPGTYSQVNMLRSGIESIFFDANLQEIRINGVRVVTTRKTGPAAVTGIAGIAYTATEQTMLNDLETAVNLIRDALRVTGGHGLTTD